MDETIEAIFEFDECAEFGDVADFAVTDHANGIFFRRHEPGIRKRLLDAERNTAITGLDIQHDHVDSSPTLAIFDGA